MSLVGRHRFRGINRKGILGYTGFTQPVMYKAIRERTSLPRLYERKLEGEGVIQQNEVVDGRQQVNNLLDTELENATTTYKPTVGDGRHRKVCGLSNSVSRRFIWVGFGKDLCKALIARFQFPLGSQRKRC